MAYKKLIKVSNVCQLVDKSKFNHSETTKGVTFTNNGDGSWTLNGTATAQIYLSIINTSTTNIRLDTSHKYLLSGCPKEGSSKLFLYVDHGVALFDYDTGSGSIGTPTKTTATITISVASNTTVNNAIFKPQLYDLTEMYGAGHEPTTVDQFYTDYPELKVSPLGFIELKNLEINNKNIKRLRYKTWNNSLNELTAVGFRESTVLKGINFINNGDGSWTIKGKKTETSSVEYSFLTGYNDFPVSNGDKILFTKMADDALNSKYSMYLSIKNSSHVWIDTFGEEIINKDVIYTMNNASAAYVGMSFVVRTNDYVDIIVVPQAYNLTKIYGSGKEPTTVEQFRQDFPEEMYDYSPYCWLTSYKRVFMTGEGKYLTSYQRNLTCKTKNL